MEYWVLPDPILHHSITPSLHHSITPSLHHSITPSLHRAGKKDTLYIRRSPGRTSPVQASARDSAAHGAARPPLRRTSPLRLPWRTSAVVLRIHPWRTPASESTCPCAFSGPHRGWSAAFCCCS